MVPKEKENTMDTGEKSSIVSDPYFTDSDSFDEPTSQSKTSEREASPVEWWSPFGGMV